MHSVASRLNSVFFSWLMFLLAASVLSGALSHFIPLHAQGALPNLKLKGLHHCYPQHPQYADQRKCPGQVSFITNFWNLNVDRCEIAFDLQLNLTDLFHWNTKQAFVWVSAEFATDKKVVNQIVLWDQIVQRGEKYILNLKRVAPEYIFTDTARNLRGNEVTFYLNWDITPYVGLIRKGKIEASKQVLVLPQQYS